MPGTGERSIYYPALKDATTAGARFIEERDISPGDEITILSQSNKISTN